MGSSIYPIAIGMSIVILSFAVAVVAIIKARAKFGNHPSFMAGLKDLKEIQDGRYTLPMSKSEMRANTYKKLDNEDLAERSEPISKEEFDACRENATKTSYQEAMFAEQLLNRISMAKIACAESNRLFLELNNVPTKVTKASQYKVEIASDRNIDNHNVYLDAIASAARWHFEGLISFGVYKCFFLKNAVDVYDEIYTAKFYPDIVEIANRYGHLVEREEYIKDGEDEDDSVTKKEDK